MVKHFDGLFDAVGDVRSGQPANVPEDALADIRATLLSVAEYDSLGSQEQLVFLTDGLLTDE